MAKLKKLNNEQTSYFCEQLWLMVNSGMQIDVGLDMIAEDNADKNIRELCVFLSNKVCDGNPLFIAMRESGAFAPYAVKMAEIGELSGRLDEVFKGLSEYYENRAEMQRTVRYSVFHPILLFIMMAVVVIVLVVKIIPMFSEIFASFDAGTGALVNDAVSIAGVAGTIVLIVLLAFIVIVVALVAIPPLRRAAAAFFSALPLTSRLSMSFALSKLADAMSMMITAGIDPEDALEYAAGLNTNKKLGARIADCLARVQKGDAFADAICDSGMLPKIYSRSLKIAYTSGAFDTMWKKISSRCGEDAQKTAASIISFIEPVIIVVMAIMIGSVLLTVMLPLMNIMTALG